MQKVVFVAVVAAAGVTVASELPTIPGTFDRATLHDIGVRFGKLRKLRDKLTGFAPKVQSEDDINELTLDE